MHLQPATKDQAAELAFLINIACEGIHEYLWTGMADAGQSAMEMGALREAREEGGFSYRNALTCMDGNELLGMMIAYEQPDPYDLSDLDDYPEIVRPCVELEARAPGSWYINAIATFEEHRGRGVASLLLREAENRALEKGCSRMSLIVASENSNARRLYEHLGYQKTGELPVIDYPGALHGGDWELMVKVL